MIYLEHILGIINLFFLTLQAEIELEMQCHGDILQLSIDDGYKNVPYKTLSGYAWTWLNFKNNPSLQWIIKLDDDLDLKMEKIVSKLPITTNQTTLLTTNKETDIICPCIMRKM